MLLIELNWIKIWGMLVFETFKNKKSDFLNSNTSSYSRLYGTCLEHHVCLFYPSLAVTTQVCLNSFTSSSGAAFRKKATFQLFLSELLTFWGKLNTPPIHYKAPAFWAPAASQQCVHTPANTVTFYWLSCRLFSVVNAKLYTYPKYSLWELTYQKH